MQPVVTNHIEKRRTRDGDERAHIAGTRVRVQDVVAEHEIHGLTPEQIAREHPQVTLAQVHAALSYYFDHRREIHQQMKRDEEFVARVQAELGTGGETDEADADSLPS